MTTLKEILDSLNSEQKSLLLYAFEYGLTQYVILPDGRYIGVNTVSVHYLIPDLKLSRGVWSVGQIIMKNAPAML